jgi:hypothetical protein
LEAICPKLLTPKSKRPRSLAEAFRETLPS